MPNDFEKAFSPAFTLGSGDRFHKILVSAPVLFPASPGVEIILTFFIIRRSSGKFSIVNVMKTYEHGKCISNNTQTKDKISAQRIDRETGAIQAVFSRAIEQQSGVKLTWHVLDLSGDTEMKEQVRKIQEFGHVAAFVDDGKIGLS